jgi:hypothetical protein
MEDEGEQNKKEKEQGKVAKQKSEGRKSPSMIVSQRMCFTNDKSIARKSNEEKVRRMQIEGRCQDGHAKKGGIHGFDRFREGSELGHRYILNA